MKAKYHHVPKPLDNAFSIRHDVLPIFGTVWHYHPEIELHYLIKGEGVRFIGDNISSFRKGEMVLLGSNLPHTWKCDSVDQNQNYVEALVMHFHPECLGKDFLNISETQGINKIIALARNGLIINGESKKKIRDLLIHLKESDGLIKIITLLHIFQILLERNDYHPISKNLDFSKLNKLDEERVDKIVSYTFNHFKEKIFIDEIANLSNLSVTSFCRYFKMVANKSYFDFLTEIRLNHACRLILDSKLTVENIAIDSGFDNTSNFYRHFRIFKGCTPKEYKKQFR